MNPLAIRLPEAIYVNGRYQALNLTTETAEAILYADWRYEHSPVMAYNSVDQGRVACTTLQAYDHPGIQQIFYRLLRQLAGHPISNQTLGVGLLGYAQSVGQTHGLGIEATDGLILRASCDLDEGRLKQAQQDFPNVKTYNSADGLAKDPEVDVVIVATPPNTHADLSLQMMAAGINFGPERGIVLSAFQSVACNPFLYTRGDALQTLHPWPT